MFGIDSSELAVIALVALLVIGPKDLPRVMRMVGNWVSKGRAMTRHVRAGFDTMMRESELEEMQKAWAAQNDAIMKATAMPDLGIKDAIDSHAIGMGQDDWMLPAPPLAPEVVDVAPAPPVEPVTPKPRRSRAKAATEAAAAAPTRKRTPRAKPEPQASDT